MLGIYPGQIMGNPGVMLRKSVQCTFLAQMVSNTSGRFEMRTSRKARQLSFTVFYALASGLGTICWAQAQGQQGTQSPTVPKSGQPPSQETQSSQGQASFTSLAAKTVAFITVPYKDTATNKVIRTELLKSGAVDVMVSVGPNFFYTVTLPCTLWFFDRGKVKTDRKKKVLFIDVRHIFTQIDRAHREFTPQQIEFISNIVRLYRGEKPEDEAGSGSLMKASFPKMMYRDVLGLCKVATLDDIEAQSWSLNPGRYVGVAEGAVDDFEFAERLEELSEELEKLNTEARELEERIVANVAQLLGANNG